MESLGEAISRALNERKQEADRANAQKSPEQLAQDESSKQAILAKAKNILGYGSK